MSATTGEDWPTSGTRESDRPRHRATQRCLDRGSATAECGEGKGTGGNYKRIDSGRHTTKVSRRPRTFGQSEGYARDPGGGSVLGRACDWRRVPFENLSGRPAGSRHTRSFWGRAISPLCRKSLSSSRLPFSVAPAVLHFRGMVMRNKAGVRAVAPAMVTDTRTQHSYQCGDGPLSWSFQNRAHYYVVVFHELIH